MLVILFWEFAFVCSYIVFGITHSHLLPSIMPGLLKYMLIFNANYSIISKKLTDWHQNEVDSNFSFNFVTSKWGVAYKISKKEDEETAITVCL